MPLIFSPHRFKSPLQTSYDPFIRPVNMYPFPHLHAMLSLSLLSTFSCSRCSCDVGNRVDAGASPCAPFILIRVSGLVRVSNRAGLTMLPIRPHIYYTRLLLSAVPVLIGFLSLFVHFSLWLMHRSGVLQQIDFSEMRIVLLKEAQ